MLVSPMFRLSTPHKFKIMGYNPFIRNNGRKIRGIKAQRRTTT